MPTLARFDDLEHNEAGVPRHALPPPPAAACVGALQTALAADAAERAQCMAAPPLSLAMRFVALQQVSRTHTPPLLLRSPHTQIPPTSPFPRGLCAASNALERANKRTSAHESAMRAEAVHK